LRGAKLRGADLRGAHLWRARLDEAGDLSDRWVLADVREVDVQPIHEDLDDWIEQLTAALTEEGTRSRVAERLRDAFQDDDRPEVPSFPDAWRSAPNVMFALNDPLPQRLGWGPPKWATEDAYDEDLAKYLGELACKDDTAYVAQGMARRASALRNRHRLHAKLLAARLVGGDCPPAAGLPNDLRVDLRSIAAQP
jgi:hypothetical protein